MEKDLRMKVVMNGVGGMADDRSEFHEESSNESVFQLSGALF